MLPLSGAALSRLRAALAPHWGALLALALFLVAGLAVLDDYGVTVDETWQRSVVPSQIRFVLGDWDALPIDHNRFYGIAFEAPLLWAEGAFGLTDSRSVYLSRHLLIHLAFLTGGLFAYLLARRLFGAGLLGLFAMALFLLHPRLYAHSFFNSKDIPFLAMFIVALFLTHRALRRDKISAFILLGAAVGILINLRIMGVVLLAGVPALRALDFALASGWEERKRVLLTSGGFALSCALAVFASLPYLWAGPFGRAGEWWATLSQHPAAPFEVFRGTLYRTVDFPPEYLPFWFSIASPPFALALGAAGGAAVLAGCARSFGRAPRSAGPRFAALLVGCFALPVLAAPLLDANMQNGWRQMHFLWAPFSLLAVFGLHWLASAFRQARWRVAVYGAAGAGLAATLVSMALIHPNEQVYFNFSADRVAAERLRSQYVMDYWGHPARQALERILGQSRSAGVTAGTDRPGMLERNLLIMPQAARERVSIDSGSAPYLQFYAGERGNGAPQGIRVYKNTLVEIRDSPPEAPASLRAAYEAAVSQEPYSRSSFDIFHADGALVYVGEPCERRAFPGSFQLLVYPEDADALSRGERALGRANLSFHFPQFGGFFDGKCVAAVPLPDYAITGIRTGQDGDAPWEAAFPLAEPGVHRALRGAVASEEPLARSVFDLYATGGELVYVKDPCAESDTEARIFLHVAPERLDDLPQERRGAGFDNLGFDFSIRGRRFDGACVAAVPLPDYPAASIRTGQFVSGEGEIWSAEFEVSRN